MRNKSKGSPLAVHIISRRLLQSSARCTLSHRGRTLNRMIPAAASTAAIIGIQFGTVVPAYSVRWLTSCSKAVAASTATQNTSAINCPALLSGLLLLCDSLIRSFPANCELHGNSWFSFLCDLIYLYKNNA